MMFSSKRCFFFLTFLFGNIHFIRTVPTCVIIDTNLIEQTDNQTSSISLRHFRLLNDSLSALLLQSLPLSQMDSQHRSLNNNRTSKSLQNQTTSETTCSLKTLQQLEKDVIIPFEFRRLHIEQVDHHRKFIDLDQRETVPDLSTVVYERRSDPDGRRFCRTCRDGLWAPMLVCEVIRCDAELLRATPRLVTEWGEVQPLDGGALYAPSSVVAVYTFAFQPHCKRCQTNGQWSPYALIELCSDIKIFHRTTTMTTNY